ncbi:hypothetical protein RHSIM_Rhsim13G0193300 [Rhododendron simsii]|uniref:Uncharacterized protein n=1 Tax=Rhododendron simsii TaxID=118357 RepID=A0A834G0V0_RHOSS|nr:hypothetical protein RHSIM_Rhsim13G0193300 [Rhododendron simsii]
MAFVIKRRGSLLSKATVVDYVAKQGKDRLCVRITIPDIAKLRGGVRRGCLEIKGGPGDTLFLWVGLWGIFCRGRRGMDTRTNGYFTNLMQSGSNEEQFMRESQYFNPNVQVTTQETQFTAAMGSIFKKQRSGNFTVEEDKLLVSAWLNISMDAIQGNDQKETTFWQRVKEFIQENEPFDSNRTVVS